MADTMTSQNIVLSSWDILYISYPDHMEINGNTTILMHQYAWVPFLCTRGNKFVASAPRDQHLLEPGLSIAVPSVQQIYWSSSRGTCISSSHILFPILPRIFLSVSEVTGAVLDSE
jgi:hypothetical protein